MQRIPLKYAYSGMILAKATVRPDGIVLAGEETLLTDTILDRLKNAGIPSIVVKGRPIPALASGLNLTEIKARLPHSFRKHTANPLMWAMKNMIEQYLTRYIAQEEEERRKAMEANLIIPEASPGEE